MNKTVVSIVERALDVMLILAALTCIVWAAGAILVCWRAVEVITAVAVR